MSEHQRILVPLALNDLDEATLRFASMICRIMGTRRIYFLHIVETFDAPREVCEQFPELDESSEDTAEREMKDRVERFFDAGPELEIRFEVAEGAPLVPVLDALRRHEIDLVIMGREPEQEWAGTLSEKVTRKAPCSALVVPRGTEAKISSMLVPVDFSERCGEAMDAAIDIAHAYGDVPFSCMHVYHVPMGYTRAGKTYEQFAEIMKHNAVKACNKFMDKRDLKTVTVKRVFVLDEKPAKAIKRAIDTEKADFLVLAARGRTDAAAMLLGSVTERCLRNAHIPVLAVKRKGDNMSFLKALLTL